MSPEPRFHSWIGSSTPDSITVGGLDLPSEVMGRLSLTDLAYLLVTHREPTPSERRMLDTVLVALADHGFTPSALATRLTHTGAPEAVQASVAAGLLGAGSVFLGPTGDTAAFLAALLVDVPDDADLAALADLGLPPRRHPGLRAHRPDRRPGRPHRRGESGPHRPPPLARDRRPHLARAIRSG